MIGNVLESASKALFDRCYYSKEKLRLSGSLSKCNHTAQSPGHTESTEVREVSGKEALSCISTLQQFTLQRGLSTMAMDVEKLGAFMNKLEAQRKEKLQQGTLDSWLQK